jgi:Cu(I)/Ag(I) efflux system membrane fusion protein/cobalt-zinc-cadmium efflux system membrane fusion protein
MHPQVVLEEPGNCPICGMELVPLKTGTMTAATTTSALESAEGEPSSMTADIPPVKDAQENSKKILYWRAPMDPTYISDKPGKSPMGMDLIPVYEGEDDLTGGPTVVIDPVTVQNIGVRTALVEKRDLYRAIRTVGHLDYNEQKLYRVNVKFSGWIEKLYVDKTGQPVRKGQPMLEIYSPELVTTQEEYLLALNNAKKLSQSPYTEISEGSRSLLESTRRRLLYWDITDKQIKNLEEKGIISKTMTLFSPVDGIVISKTAEQGMRIMSGMDLFRIADLSTIWVYASIYEYEVPWIKEGQKVEMDLPYIPGEVFIGKVDYIYPYLNQKTRDVKVRLVFPNPGLRLKPEMYANIQINSKLGDEQLAVPDEAVIHSGKRNMVFVAKGAGKFEPREVVLGPEAEGGYYQVVAGLRPGEEVVTSAQFLLDSESRLKEAIQKMLEIRMKSKEEQKQEPMNMESEKMEHEMEQ